MQAADLAQAPQQAGLEHGAALLRHMVQARVVSARMVALQRDAKIGYHRSSIGEEAAIVGSVLALEAHDWVFPGAREWYAGLARGVTIAQYIHHAFGSAKDPAKGHAIPDHLPSRALNVVPPSGVLGAHLPQAMGAAWAAKIKQRPDVALALFGDEVVHTGDFHNAMNFAGVFKAPVVFVCRSAGLNPPVTDRVAAYGLASASVNGSDVLAVFATMRAAVARARAGQGATLVEVVSPKVREPGDDPLDLGEADPVKVLQKQLGGAALDTTAEETRQALDAAILEAEAAGPPAFATIFDDVYARKGAVS